MDVTAWAQVGAESRRRGVDVFEVSLFYPSDELKREFFQTELKQEKIVARILGQYQN